MAEKTGSFYVRNINSAKFTNQCGKIKDWEKVEINNEIKEIASMIYTPFDGKFSYRIVVRRTLKKDNQTEIFSGTAYNYYGIMTHNLLLSNQ